MTDTKKTKRLERLDKLHVWHPFTRMLEWEKESQIIIERGEGCYLIDTEGRRYLDGVSSLWTNVHGHRKKEIDDAIKRQIDKISHSTLLGLGNVPSIELAEKLVSIAPKGLTKVFYSDNGGTAVEVALKMAFQFWKGKRKTFLSFSGAYHGDTFGGMSVGEIDIFVERYRPLLFKSYRAPYPYCYRCPVKAGKTYPACKMACLDELESILKKHGKNIAACIIEPLVEGAAGMITAPSGFLKGVRRLTKKYGVLLIADEVATGFGRTGRMFACQGEGVAPDFLCLAKGLSGGYLPLAATLTKKKIYSEFLGTGKKPDAFYHGHTYTGNPLGCVSAIANIGIFKKERTIEKLQPKIRLLEKLLEDFHLLEHVGEVRQKGIMCAIELVEDRDTKKTYPPDLRIGKRVCLEARNDGLIIRPLGDNVVVMPPLGINKRELREMASVIRRAIEKVTESEKA